MDYSQNKVFNILHVVSKLPAGGVENMLLRVVRGYDKKRFQTSICCIKEGGEIADELNRSGYKVEILNKMKTHVLGWDSVSALYNLIKRENIHILRTHQYHANLYGRLAGILAGVPVIVSSFHNLYRSPDKPKFHRSLFNYILSFFTDKLVAVSDSIADDMIHYDWVNPARIQVIHNGVESAFFENAVSKLRARKILNMPDDGIIVGSAGRLVPQKGHRHLIMAAAKMGDTQVAIAGDGPLMEELKDLARREDIKCFFMGRLTREMMPVFLKALDIFCFPSFWEGSPSALMEAMSAGLPIIASDIPPHREVAGEACIFIQPGNPDEIGEALNQLVKNFTFREALGIKAGDRAKMFSIENTIKSYEELFENILRQKRLI